MNSLKTPSVSSWVYLYPIIRDNQTYGVILLAYFDPRGLPEKEIDASLLETSSLLDKQIKIDNGKLNISTIKQNEIDPNILLEIIDTYNRVLLSKGGPPAYIDKSYIQDVMSGADFQTIQDKKTDSKFLMKKQSILSNGKTVGIVSIGKSLDEMNRIIGYQIILSAVVGFISIIGFLILTLFVYERDIAKIIRNKMLSISSPLVDIESISFNSKDSQLLFNRKITVVLPSDTYQDEICKLLFKSPNKKFDNIGIIDSLKETTDDPAKAKRLVYDAIEAINNRVMKQVGHLLVEHKNKEYFINPKLASKIER